jgi:hypothetical protein
LKNEIIEKILIRKLAKEKKNATKRMRKQFKRKIAKEDEI